MIDHLEIQLELAIDLEVNDNLFFFFDIDLVPSTSSSIIPIDPIKVLHV